MPIILPEAKKKIIQTLNVFETGKKEGKYETIAIFNDGPGGIKQITYGRSQTTEFGNLKILIDMYCNNNGLFKPQFVPFLPKIGKQPSLHTDDLFKKLLKEAALQDPEMRKTQDVFFDIVYFSPAFQFFEVNGFEKPLSLLVIYDSYVHSGGVPSFLRKNFPEHVPINGGSEKVWVKQYVDTRHNWLENHSRAILRKTIYRTQCFKDLIIANNWDLIQPFIAHDVLID